MELPDSNTSGVYCIQHKASGKRYIGSAARTIAKRLQDYWRDLPKGKCHNPYLQKAWNKYGAEAFVFSILERCLSENCLDRETYWIDHYQTTDHRFGYNICPVAGSRLGVPHTAETRAKVSASLKGRKLSEECRAKISAAGKGRKQSPEHAAKRMASRKATGWVHSDANRAAVSKACKGKPLSPEHRANISAAGKGRKQSAEHVAKRMASRMATLATVGQKPRSAESRARQSAAQMGRKASEATRIKMSRSLKGKTGRPGVKQSPEHIARRVAAYKATVAKRKDDNP